MVEIDVNNIIQDTVRAKDSKVLYKRETAKLIAEYIKKTCIEYVEFVGTNETELEAIFEIFEKHRSGGY